MRFKHCVGYAETKTDHSRANLFGRCQSIGVVRFIFSHSWKMWCRKMRERKCFHLSYDFRPEYILKWYCGWMKNTTLSDLHWEQWRNGCSKIIIWAEYSSPIHLFLLQATYVVWTIIFRSSHGFDFDKTVNHWLTGYYRATSNLKYAYSLKRITNF